MGVHKGLCFWSFLRTVKPLFCHCISNQIQTRPVPTLLTALPVFDPAWPKLKFSIPETDPNSKKGSCESIRIWPESEFDKPIRTIPKNTGQPVRFGFGSTDRVDFASLLWRTMGPLFYWWSCWNWQTMLVFSRFKLRFSAICWDWLLDCTLSTFDGYIYIYI